MRLTSDSCPELKCKGPSYDQGCGRGGRVGENKPDPVSNANMLLAMQSQCCSQIFCMSCKSFANLAYLGSHSIRPVWRPASPARYLFWNLNFQKGVLCLWVLDDQSKSSAISSAAAKARKRHPTSTIIDLLDCNGTQFCRHLKSIWRHVCN